MAFRKSASVVAFIASAFALAACGGEEAATPVDAPLVIETREAPAESEQQGLIDGAIAMPDRFSAEAARGVLLDGGSAVDAAVAASFVLAVTFPEAGNIGGGGFMTLVMDGKPGFVDYRETAPAAATRDMYLNEKGDFESRLAQVGALASGVPGAVRGLGAAHEAHGRLPWARLLEPAIALARDGFEVHEGLAKRVARKVEFFGEDTNFSDYFNVSVGDTLVQSELAATLQRIADVGPEEFYTGETATMTVAQMRKLNGLITLQDLAGYKPLEREPLTAEWSGRTIIAPPPPSSGGIALLQLLGMKAALAEAFDGVERNSAQYVHLVAEIEKRVFADRAEYLGDPDYYDVPVADLTSSDYIARRAAEVNLHAISETANVKPGLPESSETTHISIVDFDGNAVSLTTTLNASFGSGVVVEGAGFLLNNEMDDFSAKPGAANLYGVVGGEANAIAPGKRMLSSMTPTIVMEGNDVAMVVGTPGGPTIFTSVFQAIVNHFDYGLSVEEAVASGRFHHQLLPKDTLLFEARIEGADATAAALEAKGYALRRAPQYGDVHAITVKNGVVAAAHDPRGRGASAVIAKSASERAEP